MVVVVVVVVVVRVMRVCTCVCVFVLSSNRNVLLRFQDLFKFKRQREEDVPGAKLLVHVT